MARNLGNTLKTIAGFAVTGALVGAGIGLAVFGLSLLTPFLGGLLLPAAATTGGMAWGTMAAGFAGTAVSGSLLGAVLGAAVGVAKGALDFVTGTGGQLPPLELPITGKTGRSAGQTPSQEPGVRPTPSPSIPQDRGMKIG